MVNTLNKNIIDGFNKLIEETTYMIEYLESEKANQDSIETLIIKLKFLKKSIELIESYPYKLKTGEQLSNIKGIGKNTINRVNYILSYGQPPSEYDPVLVRKAYEYQKIKKNNIIFEKEKENKNDIINDIINNLSEEDILVNLAIKENNVIDKNDITVNKLNSQELIKNYPYAIKSKKENQSEPLNIENQPKKELVKDDQFEDGKVEDGKVEDDKVEDGKVEDGMVEDFKLEDFKLEDSFLGCFNGSFYESIKNLKEVFCNKQTDIYNFFD